MEILKKGKEEKRSGNIEAKKKNKKGVEILKHGKEEEKCERKVEI